MKTAMVEVVKMSVEIFFHKVTHFRTNPDFVLNELQRMLGYDLTNSQHQKAKVLGVQVSAGGTTSLHQLCSVWCGDSLLSDFASNIRRRLLGIE